MEVTIAQLEFLLKVIQKEKKMRYPKFIREKDTIGITAPSDGVCDLVYLNRLNSAISKIESFGFSMIETENVRFSKNGVSSSAEERAKQVQELFSNPEVSMIFCVAGGDFLLEMLTFLDCSVIQENPKWIQGFSDPTGLLFLITTKLDIATIYGCNFCSFGMEKLHPSLENNLEILKGNLLIQKSFSMYEHERTTYETGFEGYHLDTPVVWKSLWNQKEVTLSGRLIGGCLDVLLSMVGTRFDFVESFIHKYRQDGILWFFDNCELTSEGVIRGLWQLKEAGWFQNAKGILFGRSMTNASYYDISFEEALKRSLGELEIDVIWDMDFGHLPPAMTLISGAVANVHFKDGQGEIQFLLKE